MNKKSVGRMDPNVHHLLKGLLPLFCPDHQHIREVKEWYRKIFTNQPVERLLLCLAGQLPHPWQEKRFTLREQFYDPAKMFYEHLKAIIAACLGRSALLPILRANLGSVFIPSVFGLEPIVPEDRMPFMSERLSKRELADLTPEDFRDIREKGLMPKAREIYQFYTGQLGTAEFCYLPDTQGIMDIAQVIRGDEIFYDIYDDPPFVHHLMELSLAAYVSVTRYAKSLIGEALNEGKQAASGCSVAMFNCGVRVTMDNTTLLAPQSIYEFEVPYLRRALQDFGGGWVHFCDYVPQLLDILVEVPEVRGINAGYMPWRPYDYERDIRKMQETDKVFIGGPLSQPGERLEAYFQRVLRPLKGRRGLVFAPRGEGVDLSQPDKVMDIWSDVQDELLPLSS